MHKALFEGLVVDEDGNLATVAYVGEEPCYVVNDAGFHRHIPSEQVDRQVLKLLGEQIEGNEETISEQTAKMLGQEDIFTRAMLLNQIKQMDKQFDALLENGIPEDARAYMGMMGFKIVIDLHGEIIRVDQPSAPSGEDE
ncbi:MAG TPA: hypothetical protein VN452_00185 [Longilinea sp.]|nr:hypothetical protein [Longilinea sp.]